MPWVRDDWPNSAWPCELCGAPGRPAFERDYFDGGRPEAGAWFTAFVCDRCAVLDRVPKTFLDELSVRQPTLRATICRFVSGARGA